MRPSGRAADEIREVQFDTSLLPHAEGACLARFGKTRVICTATLEDSTPPWLKGKGKGWITAEYGMLPRATGTRTQREAAKGRQSGRTQEIQRLIGRSLRAVAELSHLGERQIRIDCDVIEADGGTRTAAISGGYVALALCVRKMQKENLIERDPLIDQVAAVSCGLFEKTPVLDLDYAEDSAAAADCNFVLTKQGGLVEVQATAEHAPFSEEEFLRLLRLAKIGVGTIFAAQDLALKAAT
jgi:ribonuclease PH